jgi:hypothetical protein
MAVNSMLVYYTPRFFISNPPPGWTFPSNPGAVIQADFAEMLSWGVDSALCSLWDTTLADMPLVMQAAGATGMKIAFLVEHYDRPPADRMAVLNNLGWICCGDPSLFKVDDKPLAIMFLPKIRDNEAKWTQVLASNNKVTIFADALDPAVLSLGFKGLYNYNVTAYLNPDKSVNVTALTAAYKAALAGAGPDHFIPTYIPHWKNVDPAAPALEIPHLGGRTLCDTFGVAAMMGTKIICGTSAKEILEESCFLYNPLFSGILKSLLAARKANSVNPIAWNLQAMPA